jgi:arginine decarboxylase-like protein
MVNKSLFVTMPPVWPILVRRCPAMPAVRLAQAAEAVLIDSRLSM